MPILLQRTLNKNDLAIKNTMSLEKNGFSNPEKEIPVNSDKRDTSWENKKITS